MGDSYEKWEQACGRYRAENEKLLGEFALWLRDQGLGDKTIDNHVFNVGFYINEFLLYFEPIPVREGISHVNEFFNDWFIRKAMWLSEDSMKNTATGLKKFYRFLAEIGLVEAVSVQELKVLVREEMPNWLLALRKYESMVPGW